MHFVMTLDIKEITPASSGGTSEGRSGPYAPATERTVEDHTKVVVKADTLDDVIKRARGILDSLENDVNNGRD